AGAERAASVALATSAASRRGASTNLSTAKYASANANTTRIWRSMRRPVSAVIEALRSISLSRLTPSGVSSNTQANTNAGTKAIASRITIGRGSQSGAANIGRIVLDTCTINQDATRYRPATRMTLRRLSSANRLRFNAETPLGHVLLPAECQGIRLTLQAG